jgi:hypothetical protein
MADSTQTNRFLGQKGFKTSNLAQSFIFAFINQFKPLSYLKTLTFKVEH